MTTEVYLGMPPLRIKKWIDEHFKPKPTPTRDGVWVVYGPDRPEEILDVYVETENRLRWRYPGTGTHHTVAYNTDTDEWTLDGERVDTPEPREAARRLEAPPLVAEWFETRPVAWGEGKWTVTVDCSIAGEDRTMTCDLAFRTVDGIGQYYGERTGTGTHEAETQTFTLVRTKDSEAVRMMIETVGYDEFCQMIAETKGVTVEEAKFELENSLTLDAVVVSSGIVRGPSAPTPAPYTANMTVDDNNQGEWYKGKTVTLVRSAS